jgi:hypothetical protein
MSVAGGALQQPMFAARLAEIDLTPATSRIHFAANHLNKSQTRIVPARIGQRAENGIG